MVLAQRVTVSSAGVTDEDARRSSQQGIQFMMDTGLTNAVRQYNSCLPGPYLVAKGASLLDFEQWRQRQSDRLLFLYEQEGGRVFLFSDPSPHHEALARGIHELFIQALEEPWIAKTGTSPRLRDLQTLADLGSCQYSIKLPGGNIVKEPDAFFGRRGAPFKGVAVEIAFRNENEETLAREIVLWAQVPGISGFGVKINSRKGHPLEPSIIVYTCMSGTKRLTRYTLDEVSLDLDMDLPTLAPSSPPVPPPYFSKQILKNADPKNYNMHLSNALQMLQLDPKNLITIPLQTRLLEARTSPSEHRNLDLDFEENLEDWQNEDQDAEEEHTVSDDLGYGPFERKKRKIDGGRRSKKPRKTAVPTQSLQPAKPQLPVPTEVNNQALNDQMKTIPIPLVWVFPDTDYLNPTLTSLQEQDTVLHIDAQQLKQFVGFAVKSLVCYTESLRLYLVQQQQSG